MNTKPSSDKNNQIKHRQTCHICNKSIELMGFNCRCGIKFCITHKAPEDHGCQFDHRQLQAQKIAEENPVVRGQKIQQI